MSDRFCTSKFAEELTKLVNVLIENGYDGSDLLQQIRVYLKQEELLEDVILAFGKKIEPYVEQLKKKDINYFNNNKIEIYSTRLDVFVNSNWRNFDNESKLGVFRRLRIMYNIYLKYIKN